MVNSSYLDSIGNEFGAIVVGVFSGTDEDQKAKLRNMLDCFTEISLGLLVVPKGTGNQTFQITQPT